MISTGDYMSIVSLFALHATLACVKYKPNVVLAFSVDCRVRGGLVAIETKRV